MRIKIPDQFMGKPIEGAMERVLAMAPKNDDMPVEEGGKYVVLPNEERNYIQVPQFGIVVAMRETHLGKNMFDTLEALAGERLKMPSQRQFMRHWLNVKESAEKKRKLVYADGTPVSYDVSRDLWGYMSSTDRSKFNGKNCCTWLNSLFKEENGKWFVEEDLRVETDAQSRKYLRGTRVSLDNCIGEKCYIDLNFNPQNLPTTKSSAEKYAQGKNLYFWHPKNESVAGFFADSDWAGLVCDRDPTGADSSLGVFSCAEGARRRKNWNLGV